MYDDSATYFCAFCGEPNEVDVDPFAAKRQVYVEDCQVCCRPNVLHVSFDDGLGVTIEATPES